MIQAPKTLKQKVEKLLKKQPKVESKYRILVVKPDPHIDYKIHILDPETKKIIPGLSRELGGGIRDLLQENK